jgi:hypothetical protein
MCCQNSKLGGKLALHASKCACMDEQQLIGASRHIVSQAGRQACHLTEVNSKAKPAMPSCPHLLLAIRNLCRLIKAQYAINHC